MRVWNEYQLAKRLFDQANERLADLLNYRDRLFDRTQPGAIDYGAEKVKSSGSSDLFTRYLEEKEKLNIDDRIKTARVILDDRAAVLTETIERLSKSSEPEDRVFYLRVIKNEPVPKIAHDVGYSRSQVYRILSKFA